MRAPLLSALLLMSLTCAVHAADDAHAEARRLVQQSQSHIKIDPERSRDYAEQALQRLAAQPDADLQVHAHLLLCDYHSERDHAVAQQHVNEARALTAQVQRKGLAAGMLGCEGEIRETLGDNATALALYEQQVALAEQARDDEMYADGLFNRGHLRGVRGEFALGLADLKRSHALFERLNMPQHAMTLENAIAILYNRMGDHTQARRAYESALKAQMAAGLRREQVVTQYNLGRTLENLREWDAAQEAFEAVLGLSRELDYPRGSAYALRGLASVQNARQEPQQALALLERATALQRELPDARLRAQILHQRGVALRLLRRLPESAAALSQALAVFSSADALAERAAAHGALAETLAEQGDWRGAYDQQARFKAASDQLLLRQIDQGFAALKLDYDNAARDRELALLQKAQAAAEHALAQERRAGRWLSVAISLAAVLLVVLGVLLWRGRRTSRAMRGLAMTDDLTALPNRRAALAVIESQLVLAAPKCAVLLADIDYFKAINDNHGHLAGDQILRAVAQAVRSLEHGAPPAGACLARFGGEEFVAVLPGVSYEAALAAAERLRAAVAALDVARWCPDRQLTISIGVTTLARGDTLSSLLRRADEALYAAKEAGRNRVVGRPVVDEPSAAPPETTAPLSPPALSSLHSGA